MNKITKKKKIVKRNKKVNSTYQSDIKGVYVDIAEAEKNKREEKEILNLITKTVDKRISNTKESCYLRNK